MYITLHLLCTLASLHLSSHSTAHYVKDQGVHEVFRLVGISAGDADLTSSQVRHLPIRRSRHWRSRHPSTQRSSTVQTHINTSTTDRKIMTCSQPMFIEQTGCNISFSSSCTSCNIELWLIRRLPATEQSLSRRFLESHRPTLAIAMLP